MPARRVHAGVVDQDVDPPEFLDCPAHDAIDFQQVADVGRQCERAALRLRDRIYRRFRGLAGDVDRHNIRSGRGEREGGGLPYPGSRAGHQRNPISQRHCCSLLSDPNRSRSCGPMPRPLAIPHERRLHPRLTLRGDGQASGPTRSYTEVARAPLTADDTAEPCIEESA